MLCRSMTAKRAASDTTQVPMNSTRTPSHRLATLEMKNACKVEPPSAPRPHPLRLFIDIYVLPSAAAAAAAATCARTFWFWSSLAWLLAMNEGCARTPPPRTRINPRTTRHTSSSSSLFLQISTPRV